MQPTSNLFSKFWNEMGAERNQDETARGYLVNPRWHDTSETSEAKARIFIGSLRHG